MEISFRRQRREICLQDRSNVFFFSSVSLSINYYLIFIFEYLYFLIVVYKFDY